MWDSSCGGRGWARTSMAGVPWSSAGDPELCTMWLDMRWPS
jgi:hypothetical protein